MSELFKVKKAKSPLASCIVSDLAKRTAVILEEMVRADLKKDKKHDHVYASEYIKKMEVALFEELFNNREELGKIAAKRLLSRRVKEEREREKEIRVKVKIDSLTRYVDRIARECICTFSYVICVTTKMDCTFWKDSEGRLAVRRRG